MIAKKIKLYFIAVLNRADSLPTSPTAAQATATDCGETIFAIVPPTTFNATRVEGTMFN